MDDDDPFAVVAPVEKKMSTYLKKSKDPNSKKCVETSSHGTNSTRSTAASTLPSDDLNFFSSKASEQSSKHKMSKSAFNNSSSSGSANFDFGNGLEFGDSGFGDDGFGMTDASFGVTDDRNTQSSRNIGSAPDPFLSHSAHSASKSMKNFSTNNNEFDAFGPNGFDAFGTTEFDAFGATDPFQTKNNGFADFPNDDAFAFGDDGFGADAFASPVSKEEEAWRKREEWKKGSRSRSGDLPKRSSSQRRRGAGPRRTHSTSGTSVASSDDGSSPRAGSRKKPSSSKQFDTEAVVSPERSQSSRDKSPRRQDDHSPLRKTRSGTRPSRRATLDHSGHTETSESNSHNNDSQHLPRSSRRASVTNTNSDGSLEPSNLIRIPPARNKSASGPAHRPGANRRQRRATVAHGTDFAFMQMNLPSKEEQSADNKDEQWEHERLKNQEKIMGMYRGGGLSNKSESKTNDSSFDDIGKHFDLMGLIDEKPQSSSDLGASRGKLRRGGKKKDNEKEEEEYKEPKDRKDRTKGSLLDRVAGDSSSKDVGSVSSRESAKSDGLSYSDRIMLAQQRAKRN